MNRIAFVAGLAVISIYLCGCQTKISQKHTFIAENPQTKEVSVFEVSIIGSSQSGNVKYRSGFRSAEAIDQVLNQEEPTITLSSYSTEESLRAEQANIVAELAAQLKRAYRTGDDKKCEELETRLVAASSLTRRLRKRGTTDVPDAPAEKFVISFSSDPTAVFNAIASAARNQSDQINLLSSLNKIAAATRGIQTPKLLKTLWREIVGNPEDIAVDTSQQDIFVRYHLVLRTYAARLEAFREAVK